MSWMACRRSGCRGQIGHGQDGFGTALVVGETAVLMRDDYAGLRPKVLCQCVVVVGAASCQPVTSPAAAAYEGTMVARDSGCQTP